MRQRSDWEEQVGRSWAAMARQTDRSFTGLTQVMLKRIGALPGVAVLDIGCGAGELSLAIARARPDARVIGLDVSPDLLAVARERGRNHDNAEFVQGDAAEWRDEHFRADLQVSRHGVMFFDDPEAAFAHLRSLATPGAALAFSCFRSPRDNPWATQMLALLPRDEAAPPPDPHAPGPFAFADPQRIEAILGHAGWSDVDIAPLDYAYVAGAGDDPVEDAFAFFSRIGPAAQALHALDARQRASADSDIRAWLSRHRDGNMVLFPAAAWLVTARNG